jgi:hypothetical protein
MKVQPIEAGYDPSLTRCHQKKSRQHARGCYSHALTLAFLKTDIHYTVLNWLDHIHILEQFDLFFFLFLGEGA